MIKAILFDIHEVVTKGEFNEIYKDFSNRSGVPLDVVVKFHDENITGLLTGEISSKDMLSVFNPEGKISVKEMLRLWEEVIIENMKVDERMIDLLGRLRQEYVLVALTNVTEQRYQADIRMGVYDLFKHLVLSFKEGVKKPDAKYFQRAIDISGVSPDEVIFIDDQIKNVTEAEKFGIKSIHFIDFDTLVSDLNKLKILY